MSHTNPISPYKDQRTEEMVRELAMRFISLESNRTALVTVTRVDLYNRVKNATIYFTVLPEEREGTVLDFLRRNRPEFREFIKENARLPIIPFIDFEIDMGEKNRQIVDGLI